MIKDNLNLMSNFKTLLFSVLYCLFMFSSINMEAQNKVPVGGKLKYEKTREPIVGATIFAIAMDSSVAAGSVSKEDGTFSILLERGEYTLKINYLGLQPYAEPIRVWRDDYLGTIIMKVDAENLSEVKISEKAIAAIVEGDTVSFNAKAYKTTQNASAKDLVEKMPGIQDNDGEIQAQGEKVQQVLVDGKQFFGQDPKTALSTLPAEVVDKIQVFDDKSEQSKASGIDDGTRIKTLNIVTKINMRNGEFGKVYAGYGSDDRFSAGSNLNMFRGERRLSILGQINNINQQNFSTEDLLGVVADNRGGGRGKVRGPSGKRPSFLSGFSANGSANDFMVNSSGGVNETEAWGANYQDKWGEKVDISGSYFYNKGDNTSLINTYQDYYLGNNSGQQYEESSESFSTNINHKFNAKAVYKLSPKASFFYLPSFSMQDNLGNTLDSSKTISEAIRINSLDQEFNSDLVGLKATSNLMFRLNGEKRGRSLFVQWKNSMDRTKGNNQLYANNTNVNQMLSNIDQIGDLDEDVDGLKASIMYSEPIGKKGLGLFITYDYSNSINVMNQKTFTGLIDNSLVQLDSLSSFYNNDWSMHTAGIGTRKFGRKGGFVVRLKYELAELNNNQTIPIEESRTQAFNNLLPFALYRARLKNKASWFSMYRAYTTKPTAQQLSSVVDNSNSLQLSQGNAQLTQQYGHWLMSKYNFANTNKNVVFYATVNGGWSNNFIGQSIYTATRDSDSSLNSVVLSKGTQLTKPINLDGQYSFNTFLTYGIPVAPIKSNLNVNLSSRLSNIPSMINLIKSNTLNQSYEMGLVVSSNISEQVDFTISSKTAYNLSENSLNPSLDNTYWVQTYKIKYDWIMPSGITFRTKFQYQNFYGLGSDVLDNRVMLWTAGMGKQLFKNKRGEIQLSVFDILNKNNNINQNFYDSYYEATNRNVLTRYFMVNFSYNIRKFREDKMQ